jgi:hypothetical protein
MRGTLNAFQRAMLQWNDLQPYNAVHVVRLDGRLDIDRLRQVLGNSLDQRGISNLTLDRRGGSYQYLPGPVPVGIRTPAATHPTEPELIAQIEHELNTPFRIDAPFCPIRFFALPEWDGFLLGASYFHPIADAESMILLLRGIVAAYLGDSESYPCRPFDCHPSRHDRFWFSQPGLILRKLLALPSDIRRMRHSFRPRLRDADDLENRFRLMNVGSADLGALLHAAKTWSVTVHDVLLALLMQALAALTPQRARARRRRNLSLGSIVNVRGEHDIDRERTFGLFLGSFIVSHPVPDGIGLRALATDLRCQTAQIKLRKLYLASPLELAVAGRLFSLYSTRRQRQFYHKYHPLGGGISNMNLNAYWQPEARSKPADYFRAVSTGPITPLVLSATTFGRGMTLALSYRSAVFTTAQVDELQGRLNAEIRNLGDHP